MQAIIKKLLSRKLWAMVAGVVSGLAIVFGLDEGTISTVSGAVVAVASLITYITTEGKIDSAAVTLAAEAAKAVETAVETITEETTAEIRGEADTETA